MNLKSILHGLAPKAAVAAVLVGLALSGCESPASQTPGSSSSAAPSSSQSSSGTSTSSKPGGPSPASKASSAAPKASVKPAASKAAKTPPAFSHPARMLVGYYAGWSAASGLTPDKINTSGLQVLNYAFAEIGSDLKIEKSDSYIDNQNFAKLRAMKKANPKLKTVITVGGWDGSARFSSAALTASSRSAFADSVVGFIKANGFDGVDIDWEYPTGGGKPGNTVRSSDPADFRLLLSTLRTKLNAQGAKDGKHYILSFAGAADAGYASKVGLSSVAKYVDYGMIMTYDLHGSWDPVTGFDAPLYASGPDANSVDSEVRAWLNSGFPAGKMILGVPFYGYAYQGVADVNHGLGQSFASASPVDFSTIQSKYLSNASYRKYSSSASAVPYLFNGSTFVSYDDASSLRRKAQYAVSKHLLGVGAWNLSFDKSGTLLKTMKSALS